MAKLIKTNDELIYSIVSGFVPGLPAECSLKQARELGMEGELQAAIENGNYVVATAPSASSTLEKPSLRSARTDAGDKEK